MVYKGFFYAIEFLFCRITKFLVSHCYFCHSKNQAFVENLSVIEKISKSLNSTKKLVKNAYDWIGFLPKVRPSKTFIQTPNPEPPDYNDLDCWAVHPKAPRKSVLVPQNCGAVNAQETAEADVFFIHPTSYFGKENWNAALDFHSANEFIDELTIPSEATVFNGSAKIYAPRYRQATFFAFLEGGNNSRKSLELAYEDVERAFQFYLDNYNNGRPFFIAGHSQGTVHGLRLLEERIENNKELFDKMIAAYLIGFQIPSDKFGVSLKNIKRATKADDLHCVIGYDTYSMTGNPIAILDKCEHWYPAIDEGHWQKRVGKKPVSINPISWRLDEAITDKSQSLGAVCLNIDRAQKIQWELFSKPDKIGLNTLGLTAPIKNEIAAQTRSSGFLHAEIPDLPHFRFGVMPRGNYHNFDYSLFYMDLRKNVQDRLDAYLKTV